MNWLTKKELAIFFKAKKMFSYLLRQVRHFITHFCNHFSKAQFSTDCHTKIKNARSWINHIKRLSFQKDCYQVEFSAKECICGLLRSEFNACTDCEFWKENKTEISTFEDPNKTGFRPVSRQQQERFRNKLLCCLSCCFLPPFLPPFFLPFFANFFANFYANFFGPAFWGAFLSRQYKCRTILSIQYKSLFNVFGVGGGECKSLS